MTKQIKAISCAVVLYVLSGSFTFAAHLLSESILNIHQHQCIRRIVLFGFILSYYIFPTIDVLFIPFDIEIQELNVGKIHS
jgi:hypothetical protein